MKTSLQIFGIFLLMLGLYQWQPWNLLPNWKWISEKDIPLHPTGETITQVRTFLLKTDRSLSFPLSPRVQELKVVSYGLANAQLIGESSPGWAMDLKILGSDEQVLRQGLGRHRSQPMLSHEGSTRTIIAGMPELLPMEGRSWLIRLPEGSLPSRLVLQGVPTPGIQGILVKVEASLPTNEGLRKVYWSRLTPEDRRSLARSTVYPGYLLRPREKSLMLREASRPLGPSGIEGRDYEEVNLYSFEADEESSPQEIPIPWPPYLPLKPTWEMSFQTEPTHGPLRLWTQERKSSGNQGWVCLGIKQDEETFPIAQGSFGDNLDLTAYSGNRVIVQGIGQGNILLLDHSPPGSPEAVEPSGLRSSTWPLGEGLDFPIYIPEGENIPIRLTAYQTHPTPLPLFWKAMGKSGNVLASGNLVVEEEIPSPRFGLSDNLHQIPSFRCRRYLTVDSKTTSFAMWGAPGLFVQLHHRLPRWERERDDLVSEEEDEDLNWFSLGPNAEEDFRPLALIIPSRRDTSSSSRQWSSILPPQLPRFSALATEESLGDDEEEVNSEPRTTGVAPLPRDVVTMLEIGEDEDFLPPKLIIFAEEKVDRFRLFRKDELLMDEALSKGCTVLRHEGWLSKVFWPVRWHAEGGGLVEVFLEKVVGAGNSHIRTLGVCGKKELHLTLPPLDTKDALVSARWYRPSPDAGRMRVVWENAPQSIYTISKDEVERSRVYRVKTSDLVLRPLGGNNPFLHASSSMFFPINRLKGGEPIRLRLEFPDGAAPFVSLNIGLPSEESQEIPFPEKVFSGNLPIPPISFPPPSKNLPPPLVGQGLMDQIQEHLDAQFSEKVEWVAPLHLIQIEELFFDLFSGSPASPLTWAKHGLEVLSLDGGRLLLIQDLEPMGRGLFAIRPHSDSSIMLQAPHRWKDLHTGDITTRWFSNHQVAAACWNTAKRWVDIQSGRWHQDHCDRRESLFNAFARAFVRARRGMGVVLQLHGYDTLKHNEPNGESHEMILSNGTRQPGRLAYSLFSALNLSFPNHQPALYPRDTKSLGALQNAQGQALRPFGDLFLHLEMSLDFRLTLKEENSRNMKLLHDLVIQASSQWVRR